MAQVVGNRLGSRMRGGLIDSLKFPVAEPDYRCDRIKKGEEKTRDLEEGTVEIKEKRR